MLKILLSLIIVFLSEILLANPQALNLETMVVTGSSIRQGAASKLLPVTTITSEQIKSTGVRTVNDLLKYITEIDFIDTGNQTALVGFFGESFIQMRGLSVTNTLVLLNGYRLPLNPRQEDNGNGAGVDINLIPLSSIERVEVLKSGSSAVYGSDAVAGVVNFITKNNFHGANLFGNYGNTSHGDGEEKHFGISSGLGDIATDKYNTFFSFEYFDREPIFSADRSLTETVDFRRFGGLDLRSSSAPQGNIVEGVDAGSSIRPCPEENLNGTLCRFNYNAKPTPAYVGSERWNVFASGSLQLNDTTKFGTQLLYSKKITDLAIQPIPSTFEFPDGQKARTRFLQGGNRGADRESDFFQVFATLEGIFFGQYWDISGGYGENTSETHSFNYFLKEELGDFIRRGIIDPTITTNDQSLIDSIRVSFDRESTTTLGFFNAKISGEAWENEFSTIDYATGFQWRRESLEDIPDELGRSDLVAGAGPIDAVRGSRNVFSGFAELNVNVMSDLTIQGAVRYDHYESEQNISPKVALSYTPDPRVTIRAHWGKSFLMPTFRQLFANGSRSSVTIIDDDCLLIGQPITCNQPGFTVNEQNKDLQPEKASSWNVGFAIEPTDYLSASFDYWSIDKSNEITRLTFRDGIKNGLYRIENTEIIIESGNVNLATSHIEGIDAGIDFRWTFENWGTVRISDNLTYYTEITRKKTPADETETLLNYASQIAPWRNVVSLNWKIKDWNATVFVRTTAGFKDSFDFPTKSNPSPDNLKKVSAHTEADLIIGYTGIHNLDLSIGAKNFTNEKPPFSSAASTTVFGFAHAPLYDNRGPYFFLTAQYNFDF